VSYLSVNLREQSIFHLGFFGNSQLNQLLFTWKGTTVKRKSVFYHVIEFGPGNTGSVVSINSEEVFSQWKILHIVVHYNLHYWNRQKIMEKNYLKTKRSRL